MRKTVAPLALTLLLCALAATTPATAAPDPPAAVVATPFSLLVDPVQEELAIDALATSTDPGTQHFGPFPSTSDDSGTCGNTWAEDTFDRFFTVRQTGPAGYTVYEQFKNGTFVTNLGASPGACDTTDGYGPGTLMQGMLGTMHGYFIISVTGTENPNGTCAGDPSPCATTSGFLAEFFPTAASTIGTFFFHYAGYDGDNQLLAVNEWKNASCDRGGNHGDIANVSTGPAPQTPCM